MLTLALLSTHARGLDVTCSGCMRVVGFTFRTLVVIAGEAETIAGMQRRLRCVACGTRGASTAIHWPGPGWCVGYASEPMAPRAD